MRRAVIMATTGVLSKTIERVEAARATGTKWHPLVPVLHEAARPPSAREELSE